MKRLLLALMIISPLSYAENAYYCTDELSTGIVFDKGKWREGSITKERRTIIFNDDRSSVKGVLADGGPTETLQCSEVYEKLYKLTGIPQVLTCIDDVQNHVLQINMKTMRYTLSHQSPFSYQGGVYRDADPSWVAAGKCVGF
jgi:hypothetical protein